MSETKNTEGLEKLIDLGTKNIVLGIEIGKEGVNWDDMKHVPAILENIKEIVAFVQSKPELLEEIKDIDPMEGFKVIQKVYAAYNEIKKV